jgi:hypothetical protein
MNLTAGVKFSEKEWAFSFMNNYNISLTDKVEIFKSMGTSCDQQIIRWDSNGLTTTELLVPCA